MGATIAIIRHRLERPRWLKLNSRPEGICRRDAVPEGVRCEAGWRCMRLVGQFDFTQVGVLASLTKPLAEAKISVFVVGTFDTDYLLVKGACLVSAVEALEDAGHSVWRP